MARRTNEQMVENAKKTNEIKDKIKANDRKTIKKRTLCSI